jgi:hypothetical protein
MAQLGGVLADDRDLGVFKDRLQAGAEDANR